MELKKVKVSIIVPVYKVEKYLSRCLESLMNQTLKDIEIILVDDGSPDSSPSMCDEFAVEDSRIKVIHKQNGGLGFARNSGLEIATGEFVAFVDSDDYVATTMYETLYNNAKELELDVIFCGFNTVDSKQRICRIREVDSLKIFNTNEKVFGMLLDMIGTEPSYSDDRKYQMSVWRALYSKSIIDRHNIRFYSEREFISEDIMYHFDFLQKINRLAIIPDEFYYYCENEVSLTKMYRVDRFEKYLVLRKEIIKKMDELGQINFYKLRVDRLFIGYCRSLIFSVCKFDLSTKEKKQFLRTICEDSVWKDIFASYPYRALPNKHLTILLLIKYNQIGLLFFISRLKLLSQFRN